MRKHTTLVAALALLSGCASAPTEEPQFEGCWKVASSRVLFAGGQSRAVTVTCTQWVSATEIETFCNSAAGGTSTKFELTDLTSSSYRLSPLGTTSGMPVAHFRRAHTFAGDATTRRVVSYPDIPEAIRQETLLHRSLARSRQDCQRVGVD